MRLSINWLKSYLSTGSSVTELSERLTATGLEVEGLHTGAKLAEILAAEGNTADVIAALADDALIEVNVMANRPDQAGVYGIARDLAAAGMGTLQTLDVSPVNEAPGFVSPISVRSALPKEFAHHASQFVGRYIRGVTNAGQSSLEVRARLASVGARSINPLVDVTNYFCFGFCRPLHVFDADKVVGGIAVRHSKSGEKFVGLDGKTYELPEALTVIADEAGVLAVAGVLGCERSGCTAATKNVFLEVAYFNPIQTAKAGRALGIVSAARYRFERGVDPQFLLPAEKLASQMILASCGGDASAVTGYGAGFERAAFEYRPADTKKILGLEVSQARTHEILSALGIERLSEDPKSQTVTVKPPSWRVDLTQSRDIVEEIARIVGFDAIPIEQVFPTTALSSRAPLSTLQSRQFAAQNCAATLGFHGAVTWSFMQDTQAAALAPLHDGLRIVNPIAADLNYLKPTALGNLMLAAKRNHARAVEGVALCEVGPAFNFDDGEVKQHVRVVGLRSGVAETRTWFERARTVDAFDVKGDLYGMLSELGLDPETCELNSKGAPAYYHPGLSAALSFAGKVIAFFGVVHPSTRAALALDEPCAAFEILLEELPALAVDLSEPVKNDSQIVERDFAVLVPVAVSAKEIERSAAEAVRDSGVQLDSYTVKIFDRFAGKGIEPGKKSIAFAVRMQPPSGVTLDSAAIEKISLAVFARVAKDLGAVIRG